MVQRSTGRLFWGLLVAVLGVVFLLNNLGATQFGVDQLFAYYWPVFPIYFGLVGLYEVVARQGFGNRGILWGSLILNGTFTLAFVGVLGNLNGWWAVDLGILWKLFLPVALVVIGVALLRGGISRPGARSYVAVMHGGREERTAWDDLSVINVMGGNTIDLSRAGVPDREIMIDAYAIMGGGNLLLPQGVTVVCEWTGVMGGVKVFGQDCGGLIGHQMVQAGEGPVVRVRALTVMGGIEIKQAY